MRHTFVFALTICFIAGMAFAEGVATFEKIYGDKIKKARSSASTRDDVELAKQLFEIAGESTRDVELLAVICENVYVLGSKSSLGYDTAIDAMSLLAENDESKTTEAQGKIVKLRKSQVQRARGKERLEAIRHLILAQANYADAMTETYEYDAAAVNYQQAYVQARNQRSLSKVATKLRKATQDARDAKSRAARIKKYEKELLDSADNVSRANAVAEYYIVERGDFEHAGTVAPLTKDQKLQEMIGLASKKDEQPSGEDGVALAGWLYDLSKKAPNIDREATLLGQAEEYFTSYVDANGSEGLLGKQSSLMLKKIEIRRNEIFEELFTWEELLGEATAEEPSTKSLAAKYVNGKWEGTIQAGQIQSKVTFMLKVNPKGDVGGQVTTTVGGQQQLESGTYKDGELKIQVSTQRGSSFSATAKKDEKGLWYLAGSWSQYGLTFPLDLQKTR